MVNQPQERRRAPRFFSNIPLKICSDEFDIVTETKNLSLSGAYCRVNKFLPPMSKLKVQLLLPIKKYNKVVTKRVVCQGVIVRSESVPHEPFFHVAIFFNEIAQKDLDTLNDFLKNVLENQQKS